VSDVLRSRSDNEGESWLFSNELLLGLCNMAGDVCAFFGGSPFVFGEALGLWLFFESK
jgi:hypothetical protein